MRSKLPLLARGILLVSLGSTLALAAPALKLTPVNPPNESAIYKPGEKITWRVEAVDDAEQTLKTVTFSVKQGGAKVLTQGTVSLGGAPAQFEASLGEPGTLLAEAAAPLESGTTLKASTGAAILPSKLAASAPEPADFDAFWKAKLGELAAVPENADLKKFDSGKPGVEYWKITFDNIKGSHVYGQLARPMQGTKFPAMLIVQWAGVYPLQKNWVTDPASQGWLVLNVSAHDLSIDEPKEFYDNLAKTTLSDYTAIGNTDRETSYFLRMYLGCYRAAEYLSKRPDWDGRVFLVMGTSQGGLQSFVTAGLHPKVTAMMVEVPAGCDNTGALAGRNPGWPYWKNHADKSPDAEKIMATSRYFDAVNFARRIHVPMLVGLGLADTTSPASGVFSAINEAKGPKEVVVMPDAPHQNVNKTHTPYYDRANAWKAALVKDQPAPLQPNAAFEQP